MRNEVCVAALVLVACVLQCALQCVAVCVAVCCSVLQCVLQVLCLIHACVFISVNREYSYQYECMYVLIKYSYQYECMYALIKYSYQYELDTCVSIHISKRTLIHTYGLTDMNTHFDTSVY